MIAHALGQVLTRANFDRYGNLQSVTDPSDVLTTLTYTPRGCISGTTIQYACAVGDLTKSAIGLQTLTTRVLE